MQVLINGKDAYSCTSDTIREGFKVLKEAHRLSQQRIAMKFYPGQKVAWDSRKKGIRMVGTILRVNRTSISIRPTDSLGTWKVSPSLLSPVEISGVKMIRKTKG
jgi:hypothetical protein